MASENNEIGGIVKKCKILLLDIEGTTTSISFVKDKLFPYAEENVKQFLETKWEDEGVKEAVVALRKLALEDQEKSVEGVVSIPGEDASKEDQIEGLVKNVKWQMSADRKAGPLKQLQGLIWKQGYDSGEIKGHVYDDVLPALEQWRATEGQKVYIYSSGSVDAQKLLFGQSLAGDLLPLIDGHFDTAVGAKQEAGSYAAIVEKIGCKANEILFLTDIVKEAEAARSSGVHAALVSREGNAPLPADAAATFPVLHSFAQLAVSNKRKTDPQDEQPAKIPKTDVDGDVKTAEVLEVATAPEVPIIPEAPKVSETAAKETVDATEKMEVEEVAPVELPVAENGEQKMEDSPAEKPVVEEITDSNDIGDVPISSAEPVIEESDKTDDKETEKMETEATETAAPESAPADGKKDEAPAADKAPEIITEIEEITDKQPLPEVAEVIDDIEPVVEEPTAVEDMEELQNVGESLEKECEEILSKVQDVTNLDNIPLKPLLNTIAEETMETDNVDSNDIVDRILDTEIELGMKPCEDIDLNNVAEISDTKTETAASDKIEQVETVTSNAPAEKESTGKMEESTPTIAEPDTKEESMPVETEKSKAAETESKLVESDSKSVESESKSVESEVSKPVEAVESTPLEVAENKSVQAEETKPAEVEMTETPEESKEAPEESKVIAEESKETAAVENGSVDVLTPTVTAEATAPENKQTDPPAEANAAETEVKVNGNMINGNTETVALNGDANTDELNSRLSVKNGKEVNGSNGDAKDADQEKGQGDAKEVEVADIKVKTVAVDEPRTDPIDQPTEA